MDERLANFEAFLQDVGVTFDVNTIAFTKSEIHGFGVVARMPVNVGTVVSTVPKTAILSVETSSLWKFLDGKNFYPEEGSTYVNRDLDAEEMQLSRDRLCPPIFQLPAAVLFETLIGERSLWERYLAVLPRSLSEIGVPLAEPEADVAALCKGTGVDVVSRRMRHKLRTAFEKFVRPVILERASDFRMSESALANLQLERFVLAFAWVTSRAFEVDEFHGNSLVPVADMFNHKTDGEHVHIEGTSGPEESDDSDQENDENDTAFGIPEVLHDSNSSDDRGEPQQGRNMDADTGFDSKDASTDNLQIVCVRSVGANEEMYNTFGQKSNAVLYLNYGFTEEINSYETALVHKSDVELVLHQFSKQLCDRSREMTTKRKGCIEAAGVVIYDDVLDDFFQITSDGTFCHGIMLLIYLHAISWETLGRFCDDEMELLNHIMGLTVADIMDAAGKHVIQIASQIAEQQLQKFPAETSEAADFASLTTAPEDMKPLQKHSLRIRIGQKTVLKTACDQLKQFEGGRNCTFRPEKDLEVNGQVEGSESRSKRQRTG